MLIDRRREYVAAFNTGDADALRGFYAEGAFRKMPGAPDAIGPGEIAGALASHFATFSKQRMADVHVFINDNVVTAIWSWVGQQTGPFNGVPASGRDVGLLGASIVWLDAAGAIVKEHTYWDPYGILKQLGVGPEAGRALPELPSQPTVHVGHGSAAETDNIRRLREYHDHLLSGRKEPWLDYMTDDIAWDDQMAPGLAVGKEHSASDFDMLRGAFENPRIQTTNVWGNNDFVIHQGTFIAKHEGELKGIPATHRVVHVDNMDVIGFADGKINKGWTFGNSIEMGYQLGLSG